MNRIVDITSNIENREMKAENSPYSLSLRMTNIEDQKELNRFIKSVESLVRKSIEYKIWTNYIREYLGHVSCELTNETIAQTTIDIHHHPVSLYSIVKAIAMKKIANGEPFCSFDISTETIELHYELRVGFVTLIKSLHEKFHRGYLNIPMELVKGNYMEFIDGYSPYLPEDDMEVIDNRLGVNFENCGYDTYLWKKDSYVVKEEDISIGDVDELTAVAN